MGISVYPTPVTPVSTPTPITVNDYFSEVSLGNIAGHSIMSAMGERENMSAVATGEDIWRGNELSPAPASDDSIPTPPDIGEQMTVVSENANDNPAGDGIGEVLIHYIDASGGEQEESVTLNGTTPVNTVATDIRFVNDMYATSVGTHGVARDHIKIYATSDSGLVYNMIAQGGNKSLVPNRMVPAGKSLVLKGWHAEEAQSKRMAFRMRSTDMNGVLLPGIFCFKGVAYMKLSSSGELTLNASIPALSIVKVSGWGDQAGSEGSVGWWGELIDA